MTFGDFAHLFWIAVAVSLFAAFLIFAVNAAGWGHVFVPATLLVTMAMSTAFLTAAWSVFGPGSYIKRLLWSHLVAIAVGLGYLVGGTLTGNIFDGNDDFFRVALFVLAGIPVVSLAAQLPFWFFRFFFGWQFVLGESEPREAFTLRDIFVFTFLCALGFASPQMATNIMPESTFFDPTSSYEEVTQADGTVVYQQVKLTDPEAIELKRREHRRNIRFQVNMGFAFTGVWSFAISLLSFPAVVMMFRSNQPNIGCGLIMAYAGVWFILIMVVVSSLGGGPGAAEAFGYLLFVLASYAVCLGVPFAVSREHGFRMTSPRRYRMELESGAWEDPQTSEPESALDETESGQAEAPEALDEAES